MLVLIAQLIFRSYSRAHNRYGGETRISCFSVVPICLLSPHRVSMARKCDCITYKRNLAEVGTLKIKAASDFSQIFLRANRETFARETILIYVKFIHLEFISIIKITLIKLKINYQFILNPFMKSHSEDHQSKRIFEKKSSLQSYSRLFSFVLLWLSLLPRITLERTLDLSGRIMQSRSKWRANGALIRICSVDIIPSVFYASSRRQAHSYRGSANERALAWNPQ